MPPIKYSDMNQEGYILSRWCTLSLILQLHLVYYEEKEV